MRATSSPGGLALQHGQVEVLAARGLDLWVQALHGKGTRRSSRVPRSGSLLRWRIPDVGDNEDDEAGPALGKVPRQRRLTARDDGLDVRCRGGSDAPSREITPASSSSERAGAGSGPRAAAGRKARSEVLGQFEDTPVPRRGGVEDGIPAVPKSKTEMRASPRGTCSAVDVGDQQLARPWPSEERVATDAARSASAEGPGAGRRPPRGVLAQKRCARHLGW